MLQLAGSVFSVCILRRLVMKKLWLVLLGFVGLVVSPVYGVKKKQQKGRIENLSGRLNEAQTDLSQVKKKVNELELQHAEMKEETQKEREEKEVVRKQLEVAQEDLFGREQLVKEMSAEIVALKNKAIELDLAKNDLVAEKKKVAEEKETMAGRVVFFQKKLNDATKSTNKLSKKAKQLESNVKRAQEEKTKLSEKYKSTNKELEKTLQELKKKKQENHQSGKQLQDKDRKNKQLQEQIALVEKKIAFEKAAKEEQLKASQDKINELSFALEKAKKSQEAVADLGKKLMALEMQNRAIGKRNLDLFKKDFERALEGDKKSVESVKSSCFSVKDFVVSDSKALYQLVMDLVKIGINSMKLETPSWVSSLVGLPTFVAGVNAKVTTIKEKLGNIEGALQKYEQEAQKNQTDQDGYIRSCYDSIKLMLQAIEEDSKRSIGVVSGLRSKTFKIGSFKNPVRSSARATHDLVETFLNPTFGLTSVYQGAALFDQENSAFEL